MKFLAVFLLCTLSGIQCQLEPKIIGGRDVDIREAPHQLSLRRYGTHICGAIVISNVWALTSAQCVTEPGEKDILIREALTLQSGSSQRDGGDSIHNIGSIFIHPQYDPNTLAFDIALIKVTPSFPFKDGTVKPIKLVGCYTEPSAGSMATITGWGTTFAGGPHSNTLKLARVQVINRSVCERQNGYLHATMICAGTGGKDTCDGDLGGPLVANDLLVGVASWGYGCGDIKFPGVYVNIGNYQVRMWVINLTGV